MIQTYTLTELEQLLTNNESAGIEFFRQEFHRALDARDFGGCRALLDRLQSIPIRQIQQTWQHYHAVLLFMAERRFDEAERIWRDLLTQPLAPLQQARTSLALAIQLDELGQWGEAESLYQAAIAGYQRIGYPLGLARVNNNLGIMYTFQVEQGFAREAMLTEALACHQAALAILADLDEHDAIVEEMARNWHGIARVYALQSFYAEATDAFQHMFALCQQEQDSYNRAIGLADQATLVLQPTGNVDAAQTALEEALTLLEQEKDDLHLAETWTRLGNLLAQEEQLPQAEQAYATALQHAESLRNRLTATTTQLNYRAITDFIYTAPLSLYLQQRDGAAALTAAERARARVLSDLLAGQTPLPHTQLPADLVQRRQELRQQLERQYAAAELVNTERESEIAGLETELSSLDREIGLLDRALAGLQQIDAMTATDICASLPIDSILIAYASDQQHRLYALVATRHGVQCHPLPEQLTLTWLQGIWADYIEGRRHGLVPDSEGRLGNANFLPQFYNALLAPLWESVQQAKRIYLVPTGALHYLPLGALIPTLTAAPPLLADDRRVIYAPSATVLFRYSLERTPSQQRGLLTIAPTDEKLQLTQGAAAMLANSPDDTSLLGAEANRLGVLTQGGAHRILCFLGHAFFNPQHPMLTHLKLSDERLEASEILRELRFDADLVILAACETGRSKVLRGDELLGLARALLYAGTPAVLVTAWKVHELSTRLLLEFLFAVLAQQEQEQQPFDPSSALAAAQNWLRTLTYAEAQARMSKWPDLEPTMVSHHLQAIWAMTQPDEPLHGESNLFTHPFFWAPYLLIGEPALGSEPS